MVPVSSRRIIHPAMSTVGFCGEWLILSCDTKFIALHTQENREPFVFDCSTAERKSQSLKDDNNSNSGASEETGSDKVLAFAVCPSGKLMAMTDDNKRLVLFACDPSWRCISIRWVMRRCTSLVFSQAEDELLVADKSGDVYSFSVVEPKKEGVLMMGHLSMLLAVTVSPDNKYIITADHDEKIRVSHLRSPYNIKSFCLGHQQFVSALLVPPSHPHWLLSGSGDGTVKLWEYTSGCMLQSWDLRQFKASTEADKEKSPVVCRIASTLNGRYLAVQYERVSTVQFFSLDEEVEEKLVPHSRVSLPQCPLDLTFDLKGRLWVLMDSSDIPLQIYSYRQTSWECDSKNPELIQMTEAFKPHWETFESSRRINNRFEHLHKFSFDNMTVYLQKKQRRLEEQELKRTMDHKLNGSKKAKKGKPGM